jgi:hypothetical protein
MSDYLNGDTLNRDFGSIDTVDVIALFALVLGAGVMSTAAVIQLFGHDLATVVHTFGTSTEITYAMVLPVIGLVLAVSTNEFDRDSVEGMSDAEKAAILTVVLGLAAFAISPDIASLVTDHTIGQVAYIVAHGASGLVIASE